MSTMQASHGHSEACCNVPPVVSQGYEARGSYVQMGGYRTYVTGPADADRALVVVYDIFGFFEQTLQGADLLAYGGGAGQRYRVLMPDWFGGKPCPIEWYPPDTEEKQRKLGDFFAAFPPADVAGKVPAFAAAVRAAQPSVTKLGIVGYCWGGKVVALASRAADCAFAAAASVHPAMVDAADAEGVGIPTALLASGEEPAEAVRAFAAALRAPSLVETFPDQIHGWMAARADLRDDGVRAAYERGYRTLLTFFGQHL